MVFNSLEFLFLFLPGAYLLFLLAFRVGGWSMAIKAIALISIVFYAQWSLTLVTILLVSIVFNYFVGDTLARMREHRGAAGMLLAIGVLANIGMLGYFKYANFLIDIANVSTGAGYSHIDLILPVGISFYTFIQIGYLVEAFNGRVERVGFSKYLVFSSFFPCVTAGPLVLQSEIFSQMKDREDRAFDLNRVTVGATLFAIGLFKKVVLADTIAPFANQAFDSVAAGASVDLATAWIGSLAYTLQLYFDFSGYSDMAIGLGCLFGIKLPLNFNSPFKATSISDFWRRWHMTMTRFFTTYLFMPMALRNRRKYGLDDGSSFSRFISTSAWPVIFTFLIAGIWHGAGWTFVVYGLIHGIALAINHAWDEFKMPSLTPGTGWALTMAVVVSGLVVFRAPDLETARTILLSMWGVSLLSPVEAANGFVVMNVSAAATLIAAFGAIVLLAPNSQEILRSIWVSSDPEPDSAEKGSNLLIWRPNMAWGAVAAAVAVIAVTSVSGNSTFLYYQF